MNYAEAVEEIFGIVATAWTADAEAIAVDYTPEVRYMGVPYPEPPDESKIWAFCSYAGVTDDQTAMADTEGQRKYDPQGLFYCQLFCSKTFGEIDKLRQLALLIQASFRKQSPSGNLWFRNQVIKPEIANDNGYQINVVVTCTYTTIQ